MTSRTKVAWRSADRYIFRRSTTAGTKPFFSHLWTFSVLGATVYLRAQEVTEQARSLFRPWPSAGETFKNCWAHKSVPTRWRDLSSRVNYTIRRLLVRTGR